MSSAGMSPTQCDTGLDSVNRTTLITERLTLFWMGRFNLWSCWSSRSRDLLVVLSHHFLLAQLLTDSQSLALWVFVCCIQMWPLFLSVVRWWERWAEKPCPTSTAPQEVSSLRCTTRARNDPERMEVRTNWVEPLTHSAWPEHFPFSENL